MTDVVITSKDIVIAVEQPTVPEGIQPPNIGLVEISQIVARGSMWTTGQGAPTQPGGQVGDMYLDVDTGDIYQWTGTAWDYQGTFAPTTLTPEEILAMLLTVDGAGSGVDADLLDGEHGDYYATQTDMTTALDDNAAQDAELQAHDVRITTNTNDISALQTDTTPAAILAKIITVDGAGSGLDADTLDGHDTAYFATATESTPANILAKLLTVDGSGSGLDADLLDGQSGAYYLDLGNSTGTINDAKHGNLGGGTLHAPATAAAFGFFKDAASDNKQYVRKNGAWMEVSVPPGTYVGESPPPNPPDNQMWMRSDTGALYIYYFDGNSRQWMQVSASPQLAGNYQPKTARVRNRVNNPTAQVSQENGTTAVTASGYPADQIAAGSSGIVFSGQKVTLAAPTPEGTLTAIAITATTAKASLAATDYLYMIMPVEGLDIADFDWGTANAKPVVVRFCAVCDQAGTYGLAITNGVGDRAWCGSFTIAQAGVPQVFTIAIPGDATGTWPTGAVYALSLRFSYAYGSNYAGAAGWGAGNRMGIAGTTNGAAVANSKLYITDVGLHLDPDKTGVAPAFEPPSYEDDLARCKRYWEKGMTQMGGSWPIVASFQVTSTFVVEKRAAPTIGGSFTYNGASAGTNTAISTTEFISSANNTTANGYARFTNNWTANARLI